MEIVATVAIIGILVGIIVPVIGNYIQSAQRIADQQTLTVLNEALGRYKAHGGDLGILTQEASAEDIVTALKTPVAWHMLTHQFLQKNTRVDTTKLAFTGNGARFRFVRYGSYIDNSAAYNGIVNSYSIDDPTTFKEWFNNAMIETGSIDYAIFTNPDTTQYFAINTRVASNGDKVRVWWGDGTTSNYDSISTGSNTTIQKDYGSLAARTIVMVGDISYMYSHFHAGSTPPNATMFGGDISNMPSLTYLQIWGSNTMDCNVGTLHNLTTLDFGGNNSITGDIGNLTKLNRINLYYGNNSISGDISNLTELTYLKAMGSNTLSGDINGLTGLTIFDIAGNNTVSGDCSGMTNLTYLRTAGNHTLDSDGIVALTANSIPLNVIEPRDNTPLTESQVDQILVNMDTNKDLKGGGDRWIKLNGSTHAAPSSTGETAAANLTAAGWSISTN